MNKRVMIVEDSQDMTSLYRRMFRRVKEVELADVESGEEALSRKQEFNPHLMVIDISLPGMSGLELVRAIRQHDTTTKLLVATGHEVMLYQDEAMRNGADDIIGKSSGMEVLQRCKELLGLP